MIDFLQNIPATIKLTSTLGFLTIVFGSILGIFFIGVWLKESMETVGYNRSNNLDWHSGLSYWKLVVAIILICVVAAVFSSAYNEIPRLRE